MNFLQKENEEKKNCIEFPLEENIKYWPFTKKYNGKLKYHGKKQVCEKENDFEFFSIEDRLVVEHFKEKTEKLR